MYSPTQFLHSTLVARDCVEDCVVLETRKNSVDILVFFAETAQIMTIVRNLKKDPLLYKVHQKFVMETPLRFAGLSKGRLVTVSRSNVVALSECSVSLKRISELDLSDTIPDGPENFEFFAISKSQEFLCVASRNDSVFLVSIGNDGQLNVSQVFVNGMVVHLASGNRESEFELIVVKEGDVRTLTTLEAVKGTIYQSRIDRENITGYANCRDEKAWNAIIHKRSIEMSNTNNIPIPSETDVYTDVVNQCFACQMKNQILFLLVVDQKAGLSVTDCPVFRKMWMLPNSVIIASTEDKTLLIGFPELTAKKLAKKNMKLSELPMAELPTTPVIIGAQTVNGKVIGMSEDHLYRITNVIDLELKRSKAKVQDESVELFMANPNVVLASTDGKTKVLDGKAKVSEETTLDLVRFNNRTLQVCPNGFRDLETEEDFPFENEIRLVSSNGFRLLILDNKNNLTLCTKDFDDQRATNLNDTRVNAIAMGMNFIAVGCDNNLFLMDLELLQLPRDFAVPSPCTSMCFRKKGTELFVSMQNGAIARYLLASGKGFIDDFSYICFGKPGLKIMSLDNDETLFFVDNRLHIYDRRKIYATNLTDFDSISFCVANEDRSGLVFNRIAISVVKDGGLHTLLLDDSGLGVRFEPLTEITDDTTLLPSDDLLFAVSQGEGEFSIYETETESQSGPLPGTVACTHAIKNRVFVATRDSELRCYELNPEAQSFTLVLSAQMSAVPNHICHFDGHIILCFGNTVQLVGIRGTTFFFNRQCLKLPSPIRLLVQHIYLWVVFEDGTVGAMVYNSECEQLEFVGYERLERIKSIQPIDDLTVAVVNQDNYIKLLRIVSSVSHGFIHDRVFPRYEMPGTFRPMAPVTCVVRIRDIILIFMEDGTCSAVTGFACTANYRVLSRFQSDLRRDYAAFIGFSQPNPDCLAAQRNVVSLETFDAYQSLPLQRSIEDAGRESYIYRLTCRERLRFLF